MYQTVAEFSDSINEQNYVISNEDIAQEKELLRMSGDEYYARLNTWINMTSKRQKQIEDANS